MAVREWGQQLPTVQARATEDILAPDPQTVLIRWRQPYPAAAEGLPPLPRHILEPILDHGSPEAYASHSYWTTGYVGAGPYRLERWEAGAFIEGAAFEGFALGRPRIERVVITWSSDPNSSLARLLSGTVHVAVDGTLGLPQVSLLRQQWSSGRGGTILLSPTQLRYVLTQQRPGYVNPPSLLEPRVRRALLHAIDREALAQVMLEGEGIVAESMVPPTSGFYALVDRAITKYPYDPRRTFELMGELGFTRGTDGFFLGPAGEAFAPQLRGIAEGQEAQETTIVADFLRRAGIDITLDLIPAATFSANRNELLSTFPGLRATSATFTGNDLLTFGMDKFITSNIARIENAWRPGGNRTGWSNRDFDRLYDGLASELNGTERDRLLAEMAAALNQELPGLPLYFNFQVVAFVAGLQGPEVMAPRTTPHGNAHEWWWR
jgi:peptide/nickel transport system substrate-binding protein